MIQNSCLSLLPCSIASFGFAAVRSLMVNAVCFPNAYERIAGQLSENAIVYLKGNIEVETDDEGNMTPRQFIVQKGRIIA